MWKRRWRKPGMRYRTNFPGRDDKGCARTEADFRGANRSAAGLSLIKLFNAWDLMYNRSCRKKGRLRYGEVIYRDGARKIVCVFVEGTPAGAGERDALLRRTGSRSLAALARGNRAGSGRVAARGQQAAAVHLFEPAISPASRSRA